MVSASAAFSGGQFSPASTPLEIRAALTGEEIGYFDQEYRQAMTEAAESLDLSGVLAMLERSKLSTSSQHSLRRRSPCTRNVLRVLWAG
jgi:hypothetical protein